MINPRKYKIITTIDISIMFLACKNHLIWLNVAKISFSCENFIDKIYVSVAKVLQVSKEEMILFIFKHFSLGKIDATIIKTIKIPPIKSIKKIKGIQVVPVFKNINKKDLTDIISSVKLTLTGFKDTDAYRDEIVSKIRAILIIFLSLKKRQFWILKIKEKLFFSFYLCFFFMLLCIIFCFTKKLVVLLILEGFMVVCILSLFFFFCGIVPFHILLLLFVFMVLERVFNLRVLISSRRSSSNKSSSFFLF